MFNAALKAMEKTLTDALIASFDTLGGDPQSAVNNAKGWQLNDWVNWQKAQVAATGAGAALVPGVHLAAATADMAILLHKMSYCCWGIGAIKGCQVFGKGDLINILDIWTGTEVKELHNLAVTYKLYNALTSINAFDAVAEELGETDLSNEDLLRICNATAETLLDTEGLVQEIQSTQPSELEKKVKANLKRKLIIKKVATKVAGKLSSKVGTKMALKLATKVSSKLASKILVKTAGGFFPIMGGIIAGGVNVWLIDSIAKSASVYYANPIEGGELGWLGFNPMPA